MTIQRGGYVGADKVCAGYTEDDVRELQSFLLTRFPAMLNGGMYACRVIAGSTVMSVHSEGRALDTMTGTGKPTIESTFVAEQFRVFSRELGIQGIIHNRKMWFCNIDGLWHDYNGSNPHENHIHTETLPGNQTTPDSIKRIMIGCAQQFMLYDKAICKKGDSGSRVKYVQHRLNSHGFHLLEDGAFGTLTDAAVRVFQKLAGLTQDGIVGPATYGRLQ